MLFFFNDTATTEIYTLSLHDALPICSAGRARNRSDAPAWRGAVRSASPPTTASIPPQRPRRPPPRPLPPPSRPRRLAPAPPPSRDPRPPLERPTPARPSTPPRSHPAPPLPPV